MEGLLSTGTTPSSLNENQNENDFTQAFELALEEFVTNSETPPSHNINIA